jgi:hypothetical protein
MNDNITVVATKTFTAGRLGLSNEVDMMSAASLRLAQTY